MKRGITRDYTPFLSNITRGDAPITRDCPPSLLILQGRSLTLGAVVLLVGAVPALPVVREGLVRAAGAEQQHVHARAALDRLGVAALRLVRAVGAPAAARAALAVRVARAGGHLEVAALTALEGAVALAADAVLRRGADYTGLHALSF